MKIGLEIHQRLPYKLFCNCSYEDDSEEFTVFRSLNLTASETGETDEAARLEIGKGKENLYVGSRDGCCLVELDEEPPHLPNPQSLEIAVGVAKTLNMYVLRRLRFMRKIVVDGSNTSGFQRTALVGVDGFIEIDGNRYGIDTLCLEEESADILESTDDYRKYHLSRLGISLLEISTSPDIRDGEEAKAVAQHIGLILRMTGKVARGIGSIRQDLNVSVEGGNRVEIKGAQELEMIPVWIENERRRQLDLISLISYLKEKDLYRIPEFNPIDVTSLVESNPKLQKFFSRESRAFLLRYPGYSGVFSRTIGMRRYGSELSDYAKLGGVRGIIHSDESEKYGLEDLKNHVRSDGWVMVIDSEKRAIQSLRYLYDRSKMDIVPKETRRALKDGSTEFMRPLPGAARMYPETDIPIIDTPTYVDRFRDVKDIINEITKELNRELASRILWNRRFHLYQRLKYIDPKTVAVTIEDTVTSLRRELGREPEDHLLEQVLLLYRDRKITKRAIKEVLKRMMQNLPYDDLLRFSREKISELLKQLSKDEIMKRYSMNVDYEDIRDL
ncbi:MAG: Glu-tRNA(Gln) amidotransferase subunit GatE [Candidatus Micrarchaeota archaeon]|nr:Glu-tRNA(Gln) amidotransferase subunit GatE [Candidatus Micrarchaeota archaeon]MCX8154218.1 Glu-tRNA(Gln) amidotransferase subunit GatE [Candidatus Micrarchaeota archaeon]